MATYPDDATAPITAFGVVSDVTFTNTGASRTDFNLAAAADHRGEVVAFIDGVTQRTSSYDVSNTGQTVSFLTAPNASNLTLKTISLPQRFRLTRSFPSVRAVDYSNTTSTVVNGNTFLINSNTESFSLPEGVNVSSTADFMVFLNGVFQAPDAYTYPSIIYGDSGIDIGDNTATKLLLNFQGNLTDESTSSHTVTAVPGGGTFTGDGQTQSRQFTQSLHQILTLDSSDDFNFTQRSYTLDMLVEPDTGTTMTANQSLLSVHEDGNSNYNLRLVGANSNVGLIVNSGNMITELYGGNANGGVAYHIAVSYDHEETNLRLFVNNVKVAHASLNTGNTITGNLTLGSNGVHSANGEVLDGKMNFVRLAQSVRYRGDGHEPLSNNIQTNLSGAPLGSIDTRDSLSIRVFDAETSSTDRFTSMIDRKPDKGFSSQRAFDTIKFESQAGYEKRRLRSRRSKRSYDLSYTNVTGIEKTAIENFYNARSGEFESFSFDLTHINESGTITTRFDGPLQVTQVHSSGSALTDNFYTVSFKLMETYD